MKKLIRIGIFGVIVLVIIGVIVAMSLESIIKKGVETVGPKITKVDIKLDGVSLSALTGSGAIKGLVVGNPEGYKAATAIKVGSASLQVVPKSLLSNKIVVHSINVQAPEITLEGGLKDNNLTKILANVQEFAGTSDKAGGKGTEDKSASKKLQVDEFVVSGAKVTVALSMLGGKPLSVTLPDITLKDLGTGTDGITPGELMSKVFSEVVDKTLTTVASSVGKLGKEAVGAAGDVGKGAVDGVKSATKGIGDLFKKK